MATSMSAARRLYCLAALVLASASVLPVAGLAAAPKTAHAARGCWSGYSYNGVQSPGRAYGVSATLALGARSVVSNGHVAAWIGVGGAGLGPGGSDEWVQAGIAHDAGGLDVLYYEYKRPGDAAATYVRLFNVVPGEAHALVVYERAGQRDSWRVMVDGTKVSDAITLPGSHGRFQPVATAENWDGGVSGSCNAYAFDFSDLAVRTQYSGAWQAFDLSRVLRDPAYALKLRASGFTASSR
jgi:hypothetical protein